MMLNLFDILLENIDCNQLIEEGKDPVEVLHYKFQNVPSDVIDAIIAIDPTKKKSYSQWVLSKWINEDDIISHALQNGRLEKLFQFFKEHQEKQIKDCPSVEEGLDAYVPHVKDTVLDKSTEPQTYVLMLGKYVDSDLANDFEIVFNEDNWLIAVPHTFEASCKLGENCWWCTANHFGGGDSYYKQYLRQGGEYYINFDLSQGETLNDRTEKSYPYTRYQFHFESRQFKAATENEPDVTIEELNIPQSAIDFYHEINEDYDIGEKSDEERFEDYTAARYDDNIWITDNLFLNVEFNDNWDYEAPDLDSDAWYVFDYEDDRDPISWDEVDPHIETSLIHKSSDDEVFIIKSNRSDEQFLTIVNGASESRWREWGAFTTYKNIFCENYDNVLFSMSESYNHRGHRILYFFRGGHEKYELEFVNENVSEDNTEMFINNNFNTFDEAYGFLEVILPDGYHSLIYATDNDMEYVIQRDIPANGKFYELDEENIIHAQFKNYNLSDYWENGQREDYHLVSELPNGDYLVKQDNNRITDDGRYEHREGFNILSKETRELLLGAWAKAIEPTESGYKITTESKKVFYTNFEGIPIFNGEYDNVVTLVNDAKILCGIQGSTNNMQSCDLIDETTGDIFARFKLIDLTHQPQNDKIVVGVITEDNHLVLRVYDYIKRQFDYEQYTDIKYTQGNNFIGKLEDGTYQIFDYLSGQVKIDDIVNVSSGLRYYDVSLKDGTYNRIYKSGMIISPFNFDKLIEDNGYVCGVEKNGKYYYFTSDYSRESKCLFRKDGLNMHGYIHMYGTINFPLDSGYVVGYSYSQDRYLYGQGGYNAPLGVHGNAVKKNAPQDVIEMVNYLQGNTNQPITQEVPSQDETMAMAEQFRRMLKRIDGARRLNYRDIL